MHPLSNYAATLDSIWLMEPDAFWRAKAVLDETDINVHMTQVNVGAKEPEPYRPVGYVNDGGVAVFSISGPMTKKPPSMFDGTGTIGLRKAVRNALSDSKVHAGILHVDSPGGQAAGTGDLASDLAAFSQSKPLICYAEDLMASAAYWAGSQCSGIVANRPESLVGSIGTLMVVPDMSKFAEKRGIEVLVFSTGDYKGAGVPGTAITDDQKAYFQKMVNSINEQFLSGVLAGRPKLDRESLLAVADGRVFSASDAVKFGLIDEIASMDTVLNRLKQLKPVQTGINGRKPMSLWDDLKNRLGGGDNGSPEPNHDPSQTQPVMQVGVLAVHPLVAAANAAGISTVEEFGDRMKQAEFGVAQFAALKEEAKANAIVAFGQEEGAKHGPTIDALTDPKLVQAMNASFKTVADAKFPAGGGTRQTASADLTHSGDAADAGGVDPKRKKALMASTPLGQKVLKNGGSN